MYTFDEWEKIYKKITQKINEDNSNSSFFTNLMRLKPSNKSLELLENLNKLYFQYEHNSFDENLDLDLREMICLKIASISSLLQQEEYFKKNTDLMEILRKMDGDAILSANFIQFQFCLDKQIFPAIKINDEITAKKYINSPIVLQFKKSAGDHLLSCFCGDNTYYSEQSSLLVIKLLNEINFNFNENNAHYGENALAWVASRSPHASLVKALLEIGVDPNIPQRASPLRLAACSGNFKSVEYLLQYGAKIDLIENDGTFDLLIEYGSRQDKKDLAYPEIIKMLVEFEFIVNSSHLKKAVKTGNISIVNLLLSLKAPLYEELMDDVICNNLTDLIPKLINEYKLTLPKDIPYSGFGHFDYLDSWPRMSLETFQSCLKQGLSLKRYSLINRYVLNTPEAVKYFLDRGDQVNIELKYVGQYGETEWLAHYAAKYANRESFAMLIGAGLNIHQKNSRGETPLHIAVGKDDFHNSADNSVEIVKLLILSGTNLNEVDQRGQTPLHKAVITGMAMSTCNIPAAIVLLHAGADPQIKDVLMKTALESLYTGGYQLGERIAPWHEAFKTKKRVDPKLSLGAELPSLVQTASFFIAKNASLTKNLAYRKILPPELYQKIEDSGFEQLEPPKKK